MKGFSLSRQDIGVISSDDGDCRGHSDINRDEPCKCLGKSET